MVYAIIFEKKIFEAKSQTKMRRKKEESSKYKTEKAAKKRRKISLCK